MSTDLTNVRIIKAKLDELGRGAKKSLGQHFLTSKPALTQLLDAAELTADDTVVEVGPGLGTVTAELCQRAKSVVAIELDHDFAQALPNTISADNLNVLEGNILRINLRPEIRGAYRVVAALPYNIATAVIQLFLEADRPPQLMAVLVQKEVGKRLIAKPGNRERSALTVLTERLAAVDYLATVPAGAFYPPPRVESAIIRIIPKAVALRADRAFGQLVAAGFSSKRKQLINSLSAGLHQPKSVVLTALEQTGIVPTRRAEDLSLAQWEALFATLQGDEPARDADT